VTRNSNPFWRSFFATPEYLSHQANAGAVILRVFTVRNRYRALVAGRRRAIKRNIAASGIEEIIAELDEYLNAFIEEIDADTAIKAKAKEEAERSEKNMLDVGDSVLDRAMKCAGYSDKSDSDNLKKKKKEGLTRIFCIVP